MRLSTAADRDDARSIAVIHAALDAGATLLDTSDAYCLDAKEAGHNERLIARALRECDERGVTGKDITPFLLGRIVELTDGASLRTNIALVRNNARLGAALAVAYHS